MVPIFVTIVFSMVSIFYVVSLIYFQQNDGLSRRNAVVWFLVYCAILIGIFLGIPATYDKDISETQSDYNKFKKKGEKGKKGTLSDNLKERWNDALSAKNKYFMSWFIVMLYIPLLFHFVHRCKINPMMYTSLYTFLQRNFSSVLKKEGLPPSYIPQTSGVINLLNEIDKLNIKYTEDEKKLFKDIRESEGKRGLVLDSSQIDTLNRLRSHIETTQIANRFKKLAIPNVSVSVIPEINATFLYIVNVFIISVVCFYMFIYDYDQIYFLVPLFSCTISLAIYFLKGV